MQQEQVLIIYADLRLCFCLCKLLFFSCGGSYAVAHIILYMCAGVHVNLNVLGLYINLLQIYLHKSTVTNCYSIVQDMFTNI